MGLKRYLKRSILEGAEIPYTGDPEKVNVKNALKNRYNDSFKIPAIPCYGEYLEKITAPYYLIIEAVPPIPSKDTLLSFSVETIGYELLTNNVFLISDKENNIKYSVKHNPNPNNIPRWDNKWYFSVYDAYNIEIGGIKEISSLSKFFDDDLGNCTNGYKIYKSTRRKKKPEKICAIGERISDGKLRFDCSTEVKIKQQKAKQVSILYDKKIRFILQPVNRDDAGLSNLIRRQYVLEYSNQEDEVLAVLLGLTVAHILDNHTPDIDKL